MVEPITEISIYEAIAEVLGKDRDDPLPDLRYEPDKLYLFSKPPNGEPSPNRRSIGLEEPLGRGDALDLFHNVATRLGVARSFTPNETHDYTVQDSVDIIAFAARSQGLM